MHTQRRGILLSHVLIAIAAVTLSGLYFRYTIRDNVIPRNFGVVEAGQIYRSGRLSTAMMAKVVRENNIKLVIDLGAFAPGSPEEILAQRTAQALGVRRVRFSLEGDGTGNPQHYVDALKLVADPANHPVLVHCAAGSERTSGCIMLYRRAFQGVPFETSMAESREHKHDPEGNPALTKYLAEHGEAIVRQVLAETPAGAGKSGPAGADAPVGTSGSPAR
jgi:protein tyrosine/serine phosphatase